MKAAGFSQRGTTSLRLEFAGTPAHGHINPTLPVVAELVRRGHQVRYWATPAFADKIAATGANFADLTQFVQVDATGSNLFTLTARLLRGSRTLLEHLLPMMRDHPPDAILHDSMAVWGRTLAHELRVPSVCSTTTFAINNAVLRHSRQQQHHFLRMAAQAVPDVLESAWHLACLWWRYRVPTLDFREVFINSADLHIVYTSRELQPCGETFPEHYRFVGPSISRHNAPLPFGLPDDAPLVYIALGTLLNQNLGFYQLCLHALHDQPVRVLMVVGQHTRIEDLGPIPANVNVQRFVPQPQVLEHARAFISHGGINSVQESLVAGVPLVVVAQGLDQFWTAERVRALGLGVVLERETITAASLREAVHAVLHDPQYATRCQSMGERLLAQGGWQRAADEIERLVMKKQKGAVGCADRQNLAAPRF